MNMIEKKDPHQKIITDDPPDDNDIIELTDEIITKPTDDEDDIVDLQDTHKTEPSEDKDFIDLNIPVTDEKNAMEGDEIIASAVEESLGADEDELDAEKIRPTDESDLESKEDDGEIILDTGDDDLAAQSDHDATVMQKAEEVFDAEEEIEFEYESDEDEDDVFTLDDQKTLEDLETISMIDEEPAEDADDDIRFDPAAGLDIDFDEDNKIIAMDADPHEGPDLMALENEKTLKFENSSDLPGLTDEMQFEEDEELLDIEDELDLEPADEVLSLDEFDDDTTEDEDDIIEITQFDEHFPEEDEKKLERAGVLDASQPDEEDFLELIEVEDDGQTEDEELTGLNQSEEQIDEDEIDSFFSEILEDEPESEDADTEPVEETPAMDSEKATATVPPPSENEVFDFSFDSSEISRRVEGLDTFLSSDSTTEPAVAWLPEDQPENDENAKEDLQTVQDTSDALTVTSEQIDSILERVIKEKFSGKIEHIIYEAIEKAVSKEIDRLKGSLLDSTGLGDDE